jgi:hypothetical protein
LRIAFAVVALATAVASGLVVREGLIGASPPAGTNPREPQAVSSTGHYIFYANSGHVKQGVRYQFRLYTHCGLNDPTGPDFDGSFWKSVGAGADSSGNPPPGFGNPYDDGTMTLVSVDLAEYRSASGLATRFTRLSSSKMGYLCS